MTIKPTQTGSETQNETSWTLAHDQLTFSKPENPSLLANIQEDESSEPNIVTYMDYIDTCTPEVKLEDGTKDPAVEEARLRLMQNFARPGGPGAKFKNIQDKLFNNLTLPKGAREELGITGDEGIPVEEEEEEDKPEEGEEEVDPAKVAEREKKRYDRRMC